MSPVSAPSNSRSQPHPGRVLVVFSRAADAREISRCLAAALDMDLTVVRDARVAQTLLLAAGAGRFRAIIAESDLPGGTGLDLLSRAKSLDANITTVLFSRFQTEALDMHEMFFVDHHVPAGLASERLCEEVCRALGMSPGVARPPASDDRRRSAIRTAPMAMVSAAGWPFGQHRDHEAHTPVPPPLGPVSWGNDLASGLWSSPGSSRRMA